MSARLPGLALDPDVAAALRSRLADVAEHTVEAIRTEVPGYGALSGQLAQNIEQAVQTALGAFLRLAAQTSDADPSTPLTPALEGAYALGRGEARSGRTTAALLGAYRIGARVSWRDWSETAVANGLPAVEVARFAELVFAYIDELSAASVAGHTDELASSGRVRQRALEDLGRALLQGAAAPVLAEHAERADWSPPSTLTAVLLPSALARGTLPLLDPRTLEVSGDVAGLDAGEQATVLLVPDAAGRRRPALLRSLAGRPAVVGPARPWDRVAVSSARALRARGLVAAAGPVDTDEHLAALVLTADPEALADLRARVLAPFADQKPATAERLVETLRSWLLHQGRREDVAADLVVHAQTVRYRMTQVRDLLGDRLADPQAVLELTVALGAAPR